MQRVTFDLSEDDYMHFARYHFSHSDDARASRNRMFIFAVLGLGAIAWSTKDDPHYGLHNPPMYAFRLATALVMFVVLITLYLKVMRPYTMRAMLKTGMRRVLGTTTIELTDEATQVENPEGKGRLKWQDCQGVIDEPEHIFILIGPFRAFVIPKRVFPDAAAAARFLEFALDHYRDARIGKIEKVK